MTTTTSHLKWTAALAAFASLSVAAVLVISTGSTARGAKAVSPNASTASSTAQAHHSARLHASQIHHAAMRRAAMRHHAAVVEASEYVAPVYAPPQSHMAPGTPGVLYVEWTRVAVCEEGGWIGYAGPTYPDSLGIDATNWDANTTPAERYDMSPANQIEVAQDIEGPSYVPDQNGCAPW